MPEAEKSVLRSLRPQAVNSFGGSDIRVGPTWGASPLMEHLDVWAKKLLKYVVLYLVITTFSIQRVYCDDRLPIGSQRATCTNNIHQHGRSPNISVLQRAIRHHGTNSIIVKAVEARVFHRGAVHLEPNMAEAGSLQGKFSQIILVSVTCSCSCVGSQIGTSLTLQQCSFCSRKL